MVAASGRHGSAVSQLQDKWDRFYRDRIEPPLACACLQQQRFLLPDSGSALDLACGIGGNALLMAERGLQVEAWDISPLALATLGRYAAQRQLKIATKQLEIDVDALKQRRFDVIVISRFLDRSLSDAIMTALNPQGLLFYQTFTRDKYDPGGPGNPDYLLDRNELLRLFTPLTLLHYQEYHHVGDLAIGNRNEASFIGQKT